MDTNIPEQRGMRGCYFRRNALLAVVLWLAIAHSTFGQETISPDSLKAERQRLARTMSNLMDSIDRELQIIHRTPSTNDPAKEGIRLHARELMEFRSQLNDSIRESNSDAEWDLETLKRQAEMIAKIRSRYYNIRGD